MVNLHVLSTLFHDGSKRLWKQPIKGFLQEFPDGVRAGWGALSFLVTMPETAL